MTWSFRVTSYNVLADAYATKRLYPAIDPELLSWQRRRPAVVARMAQLNSEVICLQEVQERDWPGLAEDFARRGWHGHFARKGRERPDGCALLCRSTLRFAGMEPVYFEDGIGGALSSGHLALIGSLETPAGIVHIATTHLRWQAASSEPDEHIGYRQADQLLKRCAELMPNSAGIVVCGDFNVTPASPVVERFTRCGFVDAYASSPQFTCNPNGRAARIDYIFASAGLEPVPEAIPELSDQTPLPNLDEPSDHLPLTAALRVVHTLFWQ
jgi:CCR4-NOT transcription complex subunit 6